MQEKQEGTCYLCMMLHNDYSRKVTQEHHVVFGTANRKISERYGLKVYLCFQHHEYDGGKEAVHRNREIRILLCKKAQEAFEKRWPELGFRNLFGKSYLEDGEWQQSSEEKRKTGTGIEIIDTGINDMEGW